MKFLYKKQRKQKKTEKCQYGTGNFKMLDLIECILNIFLFQWAEDFATGYKNNTKTTNIKQVTVTNRS